MQRGVQRLRVAGRKVLQLLRLKQLHNGVFLKARVRVSDTERRLNSGIKRASHIGVTKQVSKLPGTQGGSKFGSSYFGQTGSQLEHHNGHCMEAPPIFTGHSSVDIPRPGVKSKKTRLNKNTLEPPGKFRKQHCQS